MTILSFQYSRFSNACYLKATLKQQENISYFTTLITRIKSTKGYDDKYPVVYIGNSISDCTITELGEFRSIEAYPYQTDFLSVNAFSWKDTMRLWCGFSPLEGDERIFTANEEVDKMPCYPDDGSIMIIDGTVVVKFN